jgi:hypothetical protein
MVEFKSTENGATISFSIARHWGEEIEFFVEVKAPFGSAKATGSTYFNGSPALLFQSMATEWKGWKKDKTWNDLENRVMFTARADSTGHTELIVKLSEYESSFETVLKFEAGQLQEMAKEIATLLP